MALSEAERAYQREYHVKNRAKRIAASAARYHENPDKYRAQAKAWRDKNADAISMRCRAKHAKNREKLRAARQGKENWLPYIIKTTRQRTRRNGIAFDLAVGDFELPSTCPITGRELHYSSFHLDPDGASLDRIVPHEGYVRGNVRIISMLANLLRRDCMDPAVFRALADDAERLCSGR